MIIKTYEEVGDKAIIRIHQPEADLDPVRAQVADIKKRGMEQGYGLFYLIGFIPRGAMIGHVGDYDYADWYLRSEQGSDFAIVKPEKFLGRATKVLL